MRPHIRRHVGRRFAVQALGTGERAQLGPDALDLLGTPLTLRTQLRESGPSRLVVSEKLLREGAAPDLLEDPAHALAHAVVDDASSAGQVAVLGDVRNR